MTRLYILFLACAALLCGCRASQPAGQKASGEPETSVPAGASSASSYMPRAAVYRTNGPWNQNVMITLNPERDAVVSYPAPSDVSVNSSPVALNDGWLLDRRGGVSLNSAFIRLTYAEYAALSAAPSPDSLLRMVIPDARVTEVKRLPITAQEAIADPETAKKYLD